MIDKTHFSKKDNISRAMKHLGIKESDINHMRSTCKNAIQKSERAHKIVSPAQSVPKKTYQTPIKGHFKFLRDI